MDSRDTLTIAMGAYLGGTFVLHRLRLVRLREHALEHRLLSRLWTSLPDEAEPVRAALARAADARAHRDEGEVEHQALIALAQVRALGGRTKEPWLAILDAHTRLSYLVHPANLELVAIPALFRLRRALRRFGPQPALHLALAQAEAIVGQVGLALDSVGRAAFYANGDRFFLELVIDSTYIATVRPELLRTCREALARLPPPAAGTTGG